MGLGGVRVIEEPYVLKVGGRSRYLRDVSVYELYCVLKTGSGGAKRAESVFWYEAERKRKMSVGGGNDTYSRYGLGTLALVPLPHCEGMEVSSDNDNPLRLSSA